MALAYEGVEYWRNWAEFLGLPPGTPLAKFVQCGMVFLDDMTVSIRPLRQQVDHVRAPGPFADTVRSLPACADFDSGVYFRPDGDAPVLGDCMVELIDAVEVVGSPR